jgi:hemerythrin
MARCGHPAVEEHRARHRERIARFEAYAREADAMDAGKTTP